MEVGSIKTISCQLKELILKQLSDGRNHDVNDIKAFVRENSGLIYETDYTKSHLAGSLFQLVNKNKIQKVERGIYRILGDVPAAEEVRTEEEVRTTEGVRTAEEVRTAEGVKTAEKKDSGMGSFKDSRKGFFTPEITVRVRLEQLDRLSSRYCKEAEGQLRAISAADLRTDEDFDYVKKIRNIIEQIKHLKE